MPSSRAEIIPHVINIVVSREPQSILDVGIGFGKYGFLFREYAEVWTDVESGKRVNPRNWKIRIDGIEIWKKYISRVQRSVYDHIFIGDALTVLDDGPGAFEVLCRKAPGLQADSLPRRLNSYDVIFCGDMIEHLTKPDGHRLLGLMVHRAKDAVVVVTPSYHKIGGEEGERSHGGQKKSHGNPYETHLSHWTRSDFDNIENCTYYMVDGKYGIAVIEKEAPHA